MQQYTLARKITHSGVGLHNSLHARVRILPALPGSNRHFVRVDLPDNPIIPAEVTSVNHTILSTQFGYGEASICTV